MHILLPTYLLPTTYILRPWRRRPQPASDLTSPCLTTHPHPQTLEKEASAREEHTIAAGLEAAGARGRADRLEMEIARLRAQNDVLTLQNQNLLAWREHHHLTMTSGEPPEISSPHGGKENRRNGDAEGPYYRAGASPSRHRVAGRGGLLTSECRGDDTGGRSVMPGAISREMLHTRDNPHTLGEYSGGMLHTRDNPHTLASTRPSSALVALIMEGGQQRGTTQPQSRKLMAGNSLETVAGRGMAERRPESKYLSDALSSSSSADKENLIDRRYDPSMMTSASHWEEPGGGKLRGSRGPAGRRKMSASVDARSVSLDQIIADLSGQIETSRL